MVYLHGSIKVAIWYFVFEGAVCEKYSLNNNGPCINGGRLNCIGEEVAPEITCQCPPNYEGKFCEKMIENVR